MKLVVRPSQYLIPQYSLTGDLLSYLRCGLQYRYLNGSALPPSRPVQQWFGEFIHGVMEEAFKTYLDTALPPWPTKDIQVICERIEKRLAVGGKSPRNRNLREIAHARAQLAINELGPHLFPLIAVAEVKLSATQEMPQVKGIQFRSKHFEIRGVIDVLTKLSLSQVKVDNRLLKMLWDVLGSEPPPHDFEVIVDYKGMRRPSPQDDVWHYLDWQINTYAWLRRMQPESHPVIAGVLIFVNELLPSKEDLTQLQQEIKIGGTDVIPSKGSTELKAIMTWDKKAEVPDLPLDLRFRRAIRIMKINQETTTNSLHKFREVVKDIEHCVLKEKNYGSILTTWPNSPEDKTCAACDFESFCPGLQKSGKVRTPKAP
jgi:hypothetical protein